MNIFRRSIILYVFFCMVFFSGAALAEETPKVETDKYTSSAVCGKCHEHIYNRWKDSIHAHAMDDPIFNTAYNLAYRKTAGAAKNICLPCHAPTVRFTGDFDEKLPMTKEGISCDFCHTVKAVDLKASDPYIKEIGLVKRGPFKDGKDLKGKHEIAFSELHKTAEFCAGCHEYKSQNGVSIIGTYGEWKEGPYPAKGKQCQDCHMPAIMGQIVAGSDTSPKKTINEHNLLGGHSLMQLKKAVDVKVVNINVGEARTEVMVDISNMGSGHRVPTGTPTRRLILNVEISGSEGRVFREKIAYEKVLADMDGKELKDESEVMLGGPMQIIKDNRLKPGETRREVFTFYATGSKLKNVTAWVDYVYSPFILDRTTMQLEMARDSMAVR